MDSVPFSDEQDLSAAPAEIDFANLAISGPLMLLGKPEGSGRA
jgi:hypothetical protein